MSDTHSISPTLSPPFLGHDLLLAIAGAVFLGGAFISGVNVVDGLGLRPGGVILCLIALAMWLLVVVGRLRQAVIVMCTGPVLMNLSSSASAIGLTNISWIALPVAVMASGWFLGRRAAWWLVGFSALSALGFYALHKAGYAFGKPVPLESSLAGLLVALAIAGLLGSSTSQAFRQQFAHLHRSQRDLDAVLNSTHDLVCSLEVPGFRLRSFNRVFAESMASIYGVQARSGQALMQVMGKLPHHFPALEVLLNQALAEGFLQSTQPIFQGEREFDIRIRRVDGIDGQVTLSVFATDVTERVLAQRRLEYLAYHDSVTELPNHVFAQLNLKALLEAGEAQPVQLGLLLVHLQAVKSVNESHGHAIGDAYLKACASRLSHVFVRPCQVYRMPGSELLIVVQGMSGRPDLVKLCERLFAALASPIQFQGLAFPATATVGVASFECVPGGGHSAEQLLASVDLALSESKQIGPGSYTFYENQMSGSLYQQLRSRADLSDALFNHELSLHFQPVVALPDHRLTGAEALVVWQHPQHGLLASDQLIALAESTGYIKQITRWVLFAACEEAVRWQRRQGVGLSVAVNISPLHLTSDTLLQDVSHALAQSGLPASCLELEITENVLLQDHARVQATLQALCQLGVILTIDDFGTGYSNLRALRQFPIHKIKVDSSFVTRMEEDAGLQAIVKALVDVAHGNQLSIVAEGVATPGAMALLQSMGCDAAQGLEVAPPMSAGAFDAWVSEQQGQRQPVAA